MAGYRGFCEVIDIVRDEARLVTPRTFPSTFAGNVPDYVRHSLFVVTLETLGFHNLYSSCFLLPACFFFFFFLSSSRVLLPDP